MADLSNSNSGGGCLSRLFFLILLALCSGLGAAVFFITQPQDLSDIGGYGPMDRVSSGRDMKKVLQNSLDRGYPVTLTEIEINQWIGETLIAKQGGALSSEATLERVWVRLSDGTAEVIMERLIMGRPFTVSMFLQIEQLQGPNGVQTEVLRHGGPFHESVPQPPKGGRFGKLVVPQGFLLLVMPAYEKLADAFANELRLGFQEMARIKIEKNRLVLNPREPSESPNGIPQAF